MGMITRDPGEMEKFAEKINAYCVQMRSACKNLESEADVARPMIKDDAKKALRIINDATSSIVAGLAEIEAVRWRLLASAKSLRDAQRIWG